MFDTVYMIHLSINHIIDRYIFALSQKVWIIPKIQWLESRKLAVQGVVSKLGKNVGAFITMTWCLRQYRQYPC